jgi:hypothetical protein
MVREPGVKIPRENGEDSVSDQERSTARSRLMVVVSTPEARRGPSAASGTMLLRPDDRQGAFATGRP